jgi:two-component system phosphate regulon sensor histidine kinase PhoR
MKRRLLWQLLPSYVLVIFVALVSYTWLDLLDAERFVNRFVVFLISASLAIGCAVFLTRLIVEPLRVSFRDIRRGADLFARGELSRRLSIAEPRELHDLAHTLNRVGVQLRERVDVVERQRKELNATLGAMREGVIVLDQDRRLIRINEAAEHLLGITRSTALGKTVYEVIRNITLQKILDQAFTEQQPVEGDVALFDPVERSLKVYARLLADTEAINGLLIVLNDLTDIQRLENVRREFVANVSHELRTPITSIKGFVETLLDGALEDPVEARRFLEIVDRQVERLSAIFDDLLSLSRIEQQEGRGEFEFESIAVRELLETTLQSFEKRAQDKQIVMLIEAVNEIASVNRNLMEQAIGNLIDNALKLSAEGTKILVSARSEENKMVFSVADQGPGIEREHLARIFERFYRVDKGRTRKLGGTGLGLSIVKHIAQVHGGSVEVKSIVGEGSVFSIHVPKMQAIHNQSQGKL